jgi:large subunit ribosomal protein L45
LFSLLWQTLALYDRFGRLAYGSESLAKDCLEYVVFEKHISDEYGLWRIHGKIIPDWMPPGQQTVVRTMRKPNFEPLTEDADADKTDSNEKVDKHESSVAATA